MWRERNAVQRILCYALNHDGKEIEGSVGTSRARWPEAAQAELAELVLEIDAELGAGAYKATKAELDGIDRGLKAAGEGRFATSDQVDDLFRKYRPT